VLQLHDYSYSPYGLMHESNPTTVYTPGYGHRSNGINTFYHHDWLGSSRWTSDLTGNAFPQALRFDAFGNRSATQAPASWHPTDLQFAGDWGYQSEWASSTEPGLALNYLEQRYYDPAIGRFISPDPIGLTGGLNLYGYCGNDPVNRVDPTGEIWQLIMGGLNLAALAYDWETLRQDFGCGASGWKIALDVVLVGTDVVSLVAGTPPVVSGGVHVVQGALALSHVAVGVLDVERLALVGLNTGRAGLYYSASQNGPGKTRSDYDQQVQRAQKEYPKKAGKRQKHHPDPQYMGGPKKQSLEDIDAAYHQKITNRFRERHPFGGGKLSPAERKRIMDEVYDELPLPSTLDD
jgi:RHS repeat-associated protein